MDKSVLSFLMQEYSQTCMDWEEIQWLWIQYLKKGVLDLPEAMKRARLRIEQEAAVCVR